MVVLSASYSYSKIVDTQFYVDEDTYARLGYSLLQGHLASASSLWPIYNKLGYVRSDLYTPFGSTNTVEPWLDSPPLVPLLLVPLLAAGASPRLLPIIFSSLTTLLIFFLLRGQRLLAWASALTWTGFFISHQILSMLFLDSGVAFFNLLTVTMTSEYTRSRSRNHLYLAGVAAGASALSKVFGVASLLYFLAFLLYSRFGPSRESLAKNSRPLLLAASIASIWPLYGLTVAALLFIQLQQFNASRSFLSNNIFSLPALAAFNFAGGMVYYAGVDFALVVGWVAMAYSLSKRNLRLVHLSLLSYLLVVVVLRYGNFYTMIPLFPILAIGIGVVVTDVLYSVRKQVQPLFRKFGKCSGLASSTVP